MCEWHTVKSSVLITGFGYICTLSRVTFTVSILPCCIVPAVLIQEAVFYTCRKLHFADLFLHMVVKMRTLFCVYSQ